MSKGRQPTRRHINANLSGLRLVALESNGQWEDDGSARMRIAAKQSSLRFLSFMGNADHLIRELSHKWLVSVVVVLVDHRGEELDVRNENFFLWGKRINDGAEEIQPKLDAIKQKYNQRQLLDWGWVAEILPAGTKESQQAAIEARADEWLMDLVEIRHASKPQTMNMI